MHNIKHAISDTRAEVVDKQSLVCSDLFHCLEVTECKVNNVNVVSYACTVVSVVVVTEYAELLTFSDSNLRDIRQASDINLSVLTKMVRKFFISYPKELVFN